MTSQGITFDRLAPGDALVLKQLQQLNEAISVLSVMLSAPGVHPLSAQVRTRVGRSDSPDSSMKTISRRSATHFF